MNGRIPKLVVVGGTYVDMAVRCDHIPLPGQSVTGSKLSYSASGPGANQAVQAALCGCEVNLISKVGGDPCGNMVMENLSHFKVITEFVQVTEAMNTGMVVTLVNSEGENATCFYSGANSALTEKEIEAAEQVFDDADACLIHGRLPQDAIIASIRCAELHGTKVILNPATPIGQSAASDNELPSDYFAADILVCNLNEAAQIAEAFEANIRTAKLIGSDLIARGVRAAVITMGSRGCMVVDRNNADLVPAFPIELVDKTACGDAFAGALAAFYAVQKDDIFGAVKFASAAGALTCTKFGSIDAMPTKAEIIEMLQAEDIH